MEIKQILYKPKNLVKRILNWCRNHKIVTVLLIAIISGGIYLVSAKNKMEQMTEEMMYTFVRTTTLTRDGLEEAVNCTGSVESNNTSTVSYNSSMGSASTKIKTVNFAVGDSVNEGDVIIVLDNTDILTRIEEEKEKLADKVAEALERYEDAKDAYEDADDEYDDSKDTLKTAESVVNKANADFDNAKNSVSYFQEKYDSDCKKLEEAQSAYNKALKEAEEAYKTAKDEYEAAAADDPNKSTLESTMNSAKNTIADIKDSTKDGVAKNYTDAQNSVNDSKKELENAKASSNYQSYETAYNNAVNAYNSAASKKEQLRTARDNAKDSMETAEENYNDSNTSDTLEDLYEQLSDCNLVAETSGKITSLNATVGAVPNGTLATIQDTDDLKISVSVSEADVNNVSIGMSCNIRSDATDAVIKGTLTQIDPVSSQSGNFGAEVTVNDKNTGLKIGMNADVDIVISTVEDCFTVPIDAVGEDETGEFIYRHTSGEGVDMEFEKVYVTTGESNDYYIEVSADSLSEGDVIRSYSDLTIGIETATGEDAAQMGSLGGLFGGMGGGGNMPSGGGMPSGGNFPSGGDFPSGGPSGGERPSGGNFPGGGQGGPGGGFGG